MTISPEKFVRRLAAISEHDGIPYRRTHFLFDEEQKHRRATFKYKGHLALSHSFKCFFLETVERVNIECRPRITKPVPELYLFFVPRLAHDFRSLCAAERVAIDGYPYHGYTLLRNTFDNLVLTSAALQGLANFYSIYGAEPGKEIEPRSMRKLRKSTEFAARLEMTGKRSGLSQDTIGELAKWDALFDYETHGGLLSFTQANDWLRSLGPLSMLPKFDETAFAMFMNRFSEIGWMTHRLLPLLQPPGVPLADTWGRKWRLIDESFEFMNEALVRQCGKRIGAAMIELVRKKFPYNERCEFPL